MSEPNADSVRAAIDRLTRRAESAEAVMSRYGATEGGRGYVRGTREAVELLRQIDGSETP